MIHQNIVDTKLSAFRTFVAKRPSRRHCRRSPRFSEDWLARMLATAHQRFPLGKTPRRSVPLVRHSPEAMPGKYLFTILPLNLPMTISASISIRGVIV